ncbi:MAG: sigma 54-interacting transcriptional regulator [Deltaproteobacteria bacterium]|nr:sigma 54-interacting transcriptional regulator [Deltaproteobacteria bacterium]
MREFRPDLILEATNVGILCTDRQGRIRYVNDAAASLLGARKQEIVGQSIDEVSRGAGDAFREIVRTGKPQAGVKIQTSGGTVIADRNPVFDGGKVTGVVSVFKDISRYEETAKELQAYRELAKQLDAVIHSSYDGLYITNGNADSLFCNKAYLRVSGLTAADVEGKNMRELVRRGTINQSVTLEVLEKRRRVTIMQEFSNGRTAIVTGNPVFDEAGRIILVVSNVRDITELSELREQVQETRTLAKRYREELKKANLAGVNRDTVVFRSPAMENCILLAARASDVISPVLLTGESGVGKGMLARLVHNLGSRKKGPFIHVNCGAIPSGLMESELFGYEKGAFTGASGEGKPGLFEMADQGTLFLDEIGEIPLPLQVKLLKVLEENEVRRVGGTQLRKLDVRIVAATNRDLQEMARNRLFREDLFFRLDVFPIRIPPLRERPEDIHPLLDRTLGELNRRYKKGKRVRPDTLDLLVRYSFPGNVRELQNVVERSFILADGKWIGPEHLPAEIQGSPALPESGPSVRLPRGDEGLTQILAGVEREILERLISECGTTYAMAERLKVNQSTVVRKLRKLGIRAHPGG